MSKNLGDRDYKQTKFEKRPAFKAIETRYDGHHFRSRLEARWAVFFNELNIEYHYEPEGYSLEGVPYLPDFYLPQQDCFVEIKGEAPTEEEKRKALLLAFHTHKRVFLFFGPVGVSKYHEGALGFYPPYFYIKRDIGSGYEHEWGIPVPEYLRQVMQRLSNAGIEVTHDLETNDLLLSTKRRLISPRDNESSWKILHQRLIDGFHDGLAGIDLLKQHHSELLTLLSTPYEGKEVGFFEMSEEGEGFVWSFCPHCKKYNISEHGYLYVLPCMCYVKEYVYAGSGKDHHTLVRAYEKAQSARFEFGEAE